MKTNSLPPRLTEERSARPVWGSMDPSFFATCPAMENVHTPEIKESIVFVPETMRVSTSVFCVSFFL